MKTAAPTRRSLWQFVLYFLKLGTLGFGGPIALAGHMEQDLVEQRGLISTQEYKEGLAFAQLAPGPLAAQLAIYLGWVRGRVLGATLAGIAFVAPSFLMVLVLSELYVRFGGLPWMQGLFYGIGAAVIAIIARSALKLVRMTLGQDQLLWILFAVSAVVTAWTESEIIWIFLVCGLVPMLFRGRQTTPATPALALLPVAPGIAASLGGPASVGVLWKILTYFAGASLFVFGSGLAIVPFLYGGVVQQFHWLTERQFIDAVAVSMISDRGLFARLSHHHLLSSALSSRGEEPAGEGLCGRGHGRGDRGHRRGRRDPRAAGAYGRANDPHCARDLGAAAGSQEDPGTSVDPCRGNCRARA